MSVGHAKLIMSRCLTRANSACTQRAANLSNNKKVTSLMKKTLRNGGAVALLTGVALVATACGGGTTEEVVVAPPVVDDVTVTDNGTTGDVVTAGQCAPGSTITWDTFLDVNPDGWGAVVDAFQNEYDVTVNVVQFGESTDLRDALLSGLAVGGAGVGDVVTIEQDHWQTAMINPADFLTLPAIPGRWLDWAGDEGIVDGQLKGYRTDISPISIMFNADLLTEHGFEQYATPEAFSEWIGGANATWETYLAAGEEWTQATGLYWVDSMSNGPLRAAIRQLPVAFEDPATGAAIPLEDNTAVENLFMEMGQASADGLDANVPFWDGAWGSLMLNGEFVTFVAPAWMMGWPLMPSGAGTHVDGAWRVAEVFPNGGANWGGAFMAVPAHTANAECAIAFADFLTNDDAAARMWGAEGAFPSQLGVLDAGIDATPAQLEFFGGQDVAATFTELAEHIPAPPYRGPAFGAIQDDVVFQIFSTIGEGTATPEQAWQNAVDEFHAMGFAENQ